MIVFILYTMYITKSFFLYLTSLVLLNALTEEHLALFQFFKLRRCMGYASAL